MPIDPSTHARIRSALDRHASQQMRFGGTVLQQIEPISATLARAWSAQWDTLFEERHLRRVRRAIASDDGEATATIEDIADPWSMTLELAPDLSDASTQIDIRGTEGTITCPVCLGESKMRCPHCGGEGTLGYRRPCLSCRATGLVVCDACEGQGRLIELQIVDVCRRLDSQVFVDKAAPAEVMAKATRDELLRLDLPRVDTAIFDAATQAYRGQGPSDPEFEQNVRDAIANQQATHPSRIVRQRLIVRYVPIVQVQYDWRGDPGTLWIIGTEERVYGTDMPLQGAFVSRTVSAARNRLERWFGGHGT